MIKAKRLSGFRDILPKEASIKKSLIFEIEDILKKSAFMPMETPHLEYKEVLLGETTGEITKEVYKFLDNGQREVALRFDQTVPLARFIVENREHISFPFKRYTIGSVFRGERPQRGRYREFTQFDLDILEGDRDISSAEVINVIYKSMHKFFEDGFKINVNSRKVLNGFLDFLSSNDSSIEDKKSEILIILDKFHKTKHEVFLELLEKLNISKNSIVEIDKFINLSVSKENLNNIRKLYNNSTFEEGIDEIAGALELLKSFGSYNNVHVDLSIIRGLDYYTGIIFETFIIGDESLGSVCSGGRYDKLVERFSKDSIDAVGASFGIDRLINIFLEKDVNLIDVGIVATNELYMKKAIDMANKLRSENFNVDIYSKVIKLTKSMKFYNSKKTKIVSIIGEDEFSNGNYSLKNMETGEQIVVDSIESFVEKCRSIVCQK